MNEKEKMEKAKDQAKQVFDRHFKEKKCQLLIEGRIKKRNETDAIFSLRQLKEYLDNLPDHLLDKQTEILPPGGGQVTDAIMLEPIVGVGTIEELLHVDGEAVSETRSSQDFQHHPENVVLLADYNGFSKDGDSSYQVVEGGFIGNKTGKFKPWIERKNCEPSMQASQTKAFDKKLDASDQALMQDQEELAQKIHQGAASDYETALLDKIQAELYRRIYRLTPLEKLKRDVKKD